MTLQELHQKNHNLCTCSLKQTASHPVFGSGNPQASIVFIGEAPGEKEDSTGLPFCGKSGKILDNALNQAKLSRKDVYITNTVKYRPPQNRDPLPCEKESCLEWLFDELFFIQPKHIVTLGKHALQTFIETKDTLETLAGKKIEITLKHPNKPLTPFKTTLTPTFHPAATIYNIRYREIFYKNIQDM
jgi:DNA polymerase